jgi:hypothetical protein
MTSEVEFLFPSPTPICAVDKKQKIYGEKKRSQLCKRTKKCQRSELIDATAIKM